MAWAEAPLAALQSPGTTGGSPRCLVMGDASAGSKGEWRLLVPARDLTLGVMGAPALPPESQGQGVGTVPPSDSVRATPTASSRTFHRPTE